MTDPGPPPVASPYISVSDGPVGPRPWSTSAIAGFVCSLLGCLGITAVAGLILGIVGLFRTSGGRRRGFGFAVAAIPLSLLSGLASGALIIVIVVGRQLEAMPGRIEAAFAHLPAKPAEAAAALREIASPDFNASINDDRLVEFLTAVTSQHGTLTKILVDPRGWGIKREPDNRISQSLRGKFINDTADLKITFARHSGFGPLEIDDLEVAGSSPRDPPG